MRKLYKMSVKVEDLVLAESEGEALHTFFNEHREELAGMKDSKILCEEVMLGGPHDIKRKPKRSEPPEKEDPNYCR